MNEMIEQMTLVLSDDHPHDQFLGMGDTFENCHIVLESGTALRFFNCVFTNCSFEPPIPADGKGFGIWSPIFQGCVIS